MSGTGRTALAAAAAFGLPLALYASTAAPTVYGVDSAELTTGAYLLGIVHPPGSPAYLLIGHVFTWLPIGDVGFRLNLLSAVSAAACCLLLFDVILHLTAQRGIALSSSLVAAATYSLWSSAVAAEVYALQGACLLALVALGLRWRGSGRRATLIGLAWLAGISLGVHLAAVLLLPGLAILLFAPPRPASRRAAPLVAAALAFLSGAAVYLYLPLRHLAALPLDPARDYWRIDLATWSGFWWMVSGGGFRRLFFAVPWPAVPAGLMHLAFWLWSNFLGFGALVGVLGLLAGLRRAPAVHAGLSLMGLGHLAFFVRYGAGDRDMMNLPVLLLWAIWIGVGAATIARRLRSRRDAAAGRLAVEVGLVSLAALLLAVNRPWVDLHTDRSARERGVALLAALDPQAVLVGSWPDLRLVEYLQQVEGQRPDVQPVDAFFATPAERAARIAAGLASGRPVYVSTCRDLPDARLTCEPVAGCDCFRLRSPARE
ncbi:MAG: DUF2723 domain-containing protein [Deltaproteobacteria bacterium]|nr:DUF2723 domain-containing protein [Deltaproteobacteria bacterium]